MSKKVLIVEDSSIVRKVLLDILRSANGLILSGECHSASSAIAMIRHDPPDIILLDIQLSEGTGMDVLNVAMADHPSIHIIIVTNFADDVFRTHYIKAGAAAFFDKSMELTALQDHLDQLVANRIAQT